MRVASFTLSLLLGGVVAVALASCAGAADGPGSGEAASDTAAAALPGGERPEGPSPESAPSCRGLERQILAAEVAPDALVRAFGPPRRRAAETEPNRHLPDATDTLVTLSWEGLEVRLRDPPGKAPLPQRALVRSARFVRHPELAPGTSAVAVVQALGEPGRRRADALVYDCGTGASQPVTFHLREGRVERIEVSFHVD